MKSEAELTPLMRGTALFGSLDPTIMSDIVRGMREVRFEPRQTIFTRDGKGGDNSLLLLLDGRVRVSVLNAEGRELTFRFAGRGEVLGEVAVLDGGPRTADCIAVTRVTAMTITQRTLWQAIETHAPLARAVIRFLCQRVRDTSDQLEGIALYTIETRVARFLLSALKMAGLDLGADEVTLDLKATQSEMALLLGTGRPKINVAFSALENQGAVRRAGTRLICRPEALMDIVGASEV
jgi:CRP/FNR family transcriptional regulator, cyclic AMP receptor protein